MSCADYIQEVGQDKIGFFDSPAGGVPDLTLSEMRACDLLDDQTRSSPCLIIIHFSFDNNTKYRRKQAKH